MESKVKLSLIILNEKRWIEYSVDGRIDCLIEVSEIRTVYISKSGDGGCCQSPAVGAGQAYYHFSNKFTVEEVKSLMESKEPTSIDK